MQSGWRSLSSVSIALCVLGTWAAGPVPARAAEPVRPAAVTVSRILSDPRYQRALPGAPRSAHSAPARHPTAPREPLHIPLPDLRGSGNLGRLLGYGLLAIAAVLLLVVALRALLPRLATAQPDRGDGDAEPAGGAAAGAPTLEEAQLLAAQGRYVEALHRLLLAAIHRVAERRKQAPPAHLTSRELVRTLPLTPDSRQAFGELVAGVEASLFGGGAVGEADFARGVERYRTLLERRPAGG